MLNILNLLAQTYSTSYSYEASSPEEAATVSLVIFLVMFIIYIPIIVLMVVSIWKIYTKAGKPGWASLVPIYSDITMMEVIGRPGWWFLVYMVPVLGLYLAIVDKITLAKCFGKSSGFAVGLILLPILFYPMLAFSKTAQYQGPMANGTSLSM